MKLDKKQIPQLVILGLLVLGCIGYVSFTLAKPPAQAKKPAEAKPETAAVAEVTTQARLMQIGTFPNLTSPVARRDPFVVQPLSTESVESATEPTPQPVAKMPSFPKGFGKVPPLFPFGGASSMGPAPRITVIPNVEPDPAFALTGVIRGETNVAIIRVDSERHIVSEGQMINGRYRVLSVTEDGAVLAYKDRRIHLRLGGVRNAS